LRLIITGPPGSGKGTYSEKIAAQYGVAHISVGELLRDYSRTHPEVASVMAAGRLVDSRLVLEVVRQRLSQPDIKARGFILDGFPRRGEEAAALQAILGGAGVDGVIELNVPENELLRRILARGRADDKADVFKERMKIYREQTVPAVERFKSAAPVLAPEVSGSDEAANYARVKAALRGLLDKLLGRGL
jgi:adenylate kinase